MLKLLLLLACFSSPLFAAEEKLKYVRIETNAIYLQGVVSGPKMQAIFYQAMSSLGNLDLFIDSPGGDKRAAEWLINQFGILRALGKSINCYAGKQVASAAFFIYLHCDKRYAIPQSLLFPHKIHIFYPEPVLPQELISTGLRAAAEQAEWDSMGREITGMSEEDYTAFRDSDDQQWSVVKVKEKSTKKWFTLVDYYSIRMGK